MTYHSLVYNWPEGSWGPWRLGSRFETPPALSVQHIDMQPALSPWTSYVGVLHTQPVVLQTALDERK